MSRSAFSQLERQQITLTKSEVNTNIIAQVDLASFFPVNPFCLVIVVFRDPLWFELFIERRCYLGCIRCNTQLVEPHAISKRVCYNG